ncbi:MAG: guanosine monophosphate reductase [Candidatus Moranbacteria bacterium]|nr:guanosine monophosphate reductase [Candidatus Moranbacteria bacterium]
MNDKLIGQALTFDDVVIVPDISEVPAYETKVTSRLTRNIKLEVPLLSAAMDTVTEAGMALELAKAGGIGILHRNFSREDQVKEVVKFRDKVDEDKKSYKRHYIGAAIGTSNGYLDQVEHLIKAGCDVICIDLAHGSTLWARKAIMEIKSRFSEIDLIAGNVATYAGASYLADAGCDAIKIGIGGGSICTTRVITGVGVPNITAIMEAKRAVMSTDIPLIIDGGIRYSGDIVKAIVAGADCVMCGSLFAATKEAPGELVKGDDGKNYKIYRGMSVKEAMNNRTRDRYYLKEDEKEHTSQGVTSLVPYKGEVKKIIEVLVGGIQSAMENVGARDFKELYEKGRFYQVTNAGSIEGHAHDVKIVKQELNYSKNQ